MKNSSIWTGILRRCVKIRRKEDGSTAMEFALVMPVMLLILFGIIEFGSVLFLHNNMLNAARGAARRMAVAEMTAVEASPCRDPSGKLEFNFYGRGSRARSLGPDR